MLKRANRLPPKTSFTKAGTITTPEFVIKVRENAQTLKRFGFVVSKRVDKRAVIRNRLRRIVRAQIEQLVEKIVPGYDMLFILKKRFSESEKNDVHKRMLAALKEKDLLT